MPSPPFAPHFSSPPPPPDDDDDDDDVTVIPGNTRKLEIQLGRWGILQQPNRVRAHIWRQQTQPSKRSWVCSRRTESIRLPLWQSHHRPYTGHRTTIWGGVWPMGGLRRLWRLPPTHWQLADHVHGAQARHQIPVITGDGTCLHHAVSKITCRKIDSGYFKEDKTISLKQPFRSFVFFFFLPVTSMFSYTQLNTQDSVQYCISLKHQHECLDEKCITICTISREFHANHHIARIKYFRTSFYSLISVLFAVLLVKFESCISLYLGICPSIPVDYSILIWIPISLSISSINQDEIHLLFLFFNILEAYFVTNRRL